MEEIMLDIRLDSPVGKLDEAMKMNKTASSKGERFRNVFFKEINILKGCSI
ncbi:hypothetical protein [Bacillus subtilis]|uniref:hypothetical protein n=1 Tax=Bacillus subtilis TaxID=1423 RepID=UPI000AB4245B|nr:hypothetical protein [Bacillus subtilis]